MGKGRGGTTLIKGANGQVYRVPVSLLMNVLGNFAQAEEDDSDEKEEEEEP